MARSGAATKADSTRPGTVPMHSTLGWSRWASSQVSTACICALDSMGTLAQCWEVCPLGMPLGARVHGKRGQVANVEGPPEPRAHAPPAGVAAWMRGAWLWPLFQRRW